MGMASASVSQINLAGSEEQDGISAPEQEADSVWNQDTLVAIQQFSKELDLIKSEREVLNDRKALAQSKLVNMGFNKEGLHAAIKYANTEEDKRQNFDLSYMFARKALGHPVQDDLFAAAMQQSVKVHKAEAKKADEDEEF